MGRPIEKMVIVPAPGEAGGVLEGIFLPAAGRTRGAAVVAPPHPLYGGSMDNPVVSEVACACQDLGLASLRFNWRGVGASPGEARGDPVEAARDCRAALEQAAETVPGELLAAGYSFGAVAALAAASSRDLPRPVTRLVLIAPPPALLPPGALEAPSVPVLVVTGAADVLAPPDELSRRVAGRPGVRLEVIPEADHFFGAGLGELRRVLLENLRDASAG